MWNSFARFVRARFARSGAVPPGRRHRRIRRLAGVGAILLVGLVIWLRAGPLPPGLLHDVAMTSTVIVDRHGETLHESRSALGLRGDWLTASEVPALLAQATMAAEDRRFRWHPGIDPIAVARAAYRNMRVLRTVEGGSTITQQVAELLISRLSNGTPARGWRAKARETIVAIRLEHRLSKDEILALYVNLAPYGNQIQGAGRASRAYFGRAASTLTPAEAAFLAALPHRPGRFNPWRDPSRAAPRQARVLSVMAERGWISKDSYAAAQKERLVLGRTTTAMLAPHFVERVLERAAPSRPSKIETTLDATLQRTIHGIISAERDMLRRHHANNVAVAVLDNRTGDWLAWEGSGDYLDQEHGGAIDGVVSPRQPGSALKPFTYAAAFERGFHPATVLADVPSQFPTAQAGVLYSPRNYDGRFRGPILARTALAGSENVPAVALAEEVGVPAIARLLRSAGLTTLDNNAAHYGLGLTLGNAEVRLDELVAAYAMIARGGQTIATRMIRSVDGREEPKHSGARLISERTAFWITDILGDANARAYVFGRGGSLEFPFPVSAKTGTSQSYFDNWVVGYTADVTVGVWVGNFDRTPLRGSSGVTGAGPIFHAVMLAAVEQVRGTLLPGDVSPIVAPPPDVQRREVCAMSGMAAGQACPTRAAEWLPDGYSDEECTWHHASDRGLVTLWPEKFTDWARDQGFDPSPVLSFTSARSSADAATTSGRDATAAPFRGRSGGGRTTRLTIVRPLAGAVFLMDPTLRPEFQTLALDARGGAEGPREWFIDGRPVGTQQARETLRWPLERGRHQITVRDAGGASAAAIVEVR